MVPGHQDSEIAEFRRFAKAAYKSLILENGKAVLHGGLGVNLRLDDQLEVTDAELDRMESELEMNADKYAEEMLEEMEAKGLRSPDDMLARAKEVKQVADAYVDKLVKHLKSVK
jgi:hypothetical protein